MTNQLADRLYDAALAQLTDQRERDILQFTQLMERNGPDLVMTWWRNVTAEMYGPYAPSTPSDPRR